MTQHKTILIVLRHLLLGVLIFTGILQASAVDPLIQQLAEREIQRRQQMAVLAQENMAEGAEAYNEGDYERAVGLYRGAVEMLPDSERTGALREQAISDMVDSVLQLTEQRIAEARWADAETLVDFALEFRPEDERALSLKDKLIDPEYFPKQRTPRYVAQVQDVKRLLQEGRGFYLDGQYDLAIKRCDQVLNIDPYNAAAYRLKEEVWSTIRRENVPAVYNNTRAELLSQVGMAWGTPVNEYGEVRGFGDEGPGEEMGERERINRLLDTLIVPTVELNDATVEEALEFLRFQSIQLDPDGQGIDFVLRLDEGGSSGGGAPAPAADESIDFDDFGSSDDAGAAPAASGGSVSALPRIDLRLRNAPLREVLRYVTEIAGLEFIVEDFAVLIVPQGADTAARGRVITKTIRVPPDFITRAVGSGGGGGDASGGGGGGFGFGEPSGDGGSEPSLSGPSATAEEALRQLGINLPPAGGATFDPGTATLTVTATSAQIRQIEAIAQQMQSQVAKQVKIEAKFLEVTQDNFTELGFDWLLGAANVPGNNGVFFSGGTEGFTNPPLDQSTFPFNAPGAGAPVGTNPVTGGLRSGNVGIASDSIDSLLFPAPARDGLLISPGIFSVAGVFTDPQFQVVVRALDQKRAVDLLSAPSVTTKSGQRAVIEVNREFPFPVEFDPPQIPQDFGSIGGTALVPGTLGTPPSSFPVTPTTPVTFETKNTGVTLEVDPTVGADNVTIDLNLIPEVIEFEGFINYGSPIQTFSTNAIGVATPIVITPNVINQPVFSVRRVSTNITIWDGSTVVLGGLMREDIQKVEDKVPFLGDIPLVGRLFKSEAEQHVQQNLVIFVTATLIDPAGVPLRQSERLQEDPVEELGIPDPIKKRVPEIPVFK